MFLNLGVVFLGTKVERKRSILVSTVIGFFFGFRCTLSF